MRSEYLKTFSCCGRMEISVLSMWRVIDWQIELIKEFPVILIQRTPFLINQTILYLDQ